MKHTSFSARRSNSLFSLSRVYILLFVSLVSACDINTIADNDRVVNPPDTLPDTTDEPSVDPPPTDSSVPVSALALIESQNCDELKQYLIGSLVKQYTQISQYGYYSCAAPGTGSDGIPPPPPLSSAPTVPSPVFSGGDSETAEKSVPDDISGTNNQEVDVNEGDIVKTAQDGTMYTVRYKDLYVTRGFPPSEMSLLKRYDLPGYAREMHLDETNNRLLVVINSNTESISKPVVGDGAAANGLPTIIHEDQSSSVYKQQFSLLIFDITMRTEPILLKLLTMDGSYISSRHIDQRLHIISSAFFQTEDAINDPEFLQLQRGFQNAVQRARCDLNLHTPEAILNQPTVAAARQALSDKITDAITQIDVNALLPKARQSLAGDESSTQVGFLQCTDVYHPGISNRFGLQLLSSVDTSGENLHSTGIVNYARIIYANRQHIYLVEEDRNWFLPLDDGESAGTQSVIYQFAISTLKPQYLAGGRVDGSVHNSFSLSEYNDTLRVATTQRTSTVVESDGRRIIEGEITNHLFTLQRNSTSLDIVGEVRNFGNSESIRSTRFIGNKGFVVTFRRIDPLFTFDLTDPFNPVLKGELEIPGFSEYIHPFGDRHLITVGRATGAGASDGVKIQLFNVSDLSNPTLVDDHLPSTLQGQSWSAAEYDHKAFTFHEKSNLLAIPMHIYGGNTERFVGILVFRVDINGITEIGRVDHHDLAWDSYCGSNTAVGSDTYGCGNNTYIWYARPNRSVVMTQDAGTYLYTVSESGIKANDIDNFEMPLNSVVFPRRRTVDIEPIKLPTTK